MVLPLCEITGAFADLISVCVIMIGLTQKTAAAAADFFSADIIMIGTACEISVAAGYLVTICVEMVISAF